MIETERLLLRKPRAADADEIVAFISDPEAVRYIGTGATGDRDAAVTAVERWLAGWEMNGVGHLVIERKDDGRVLGRVGAIVWDTRDWEIRSLAEAGEYAQPELGWGLIREFWGCGYATEAAREARDWLRDTCGVGRLISVIHPDNLRSQHVAERLGATPAYTIELRDSGPAVVWEHPE